MHFTFKQSKIWEAGDPVDPDGETVSVRAKSEGKARMILPSPGTGRVWVLLTEEDPIRET